MHEDISAFAFIGFVLNLLVLAGLLCILRAQRAAQRRLQRQIYDLTAALALAALERDLAAAGIQTKPEAERR